MWKPTVLCDHKLLCAFHSWLLFSHFKYLQRGDKEMGESLSFLACHMLVPYIIMGSVIKKAKENNKWLEMEKN